MDIALVNSNRIKPPIGPIGLDYLAEALSASGHRVEILDLCWEHDPVESVAGFLRGREFRLVGVSIRNTDDCAFPSKESFLHEHGETIAAIRAHSDAPVILGGVGFSVMPETLLARFHADAGIWGEGEFVLPELARKLEEGGEWRGLPNLVYPLKGRYYRNPPVEFDLGDLPAMSRGFVDNLRYYREGGQAGIETKRGCGSPCIYCADPIAKGTRVRVRPPRAVADEIEGLLALGISHLHTCDSEFNLPEWHALSVCEELIQRRLGDRLQWYAYCAPAPFSPELAKAMSRAGCRGINFGVDSGDPGMLGRLGRSFGPEDIVRATRLTRESGMAVMLDLLLGAPGESRESIVRTIDLMRNASPDRVGIAAGVRVYPKTELSTIVVKGEKSAGLTGGHDLAEPVFFIEPEVEPFMFGLLHELVGGDTRFFFFDPEHSSRNYNYNANQVLVEAIQKGYRGAYWDILRRQTG